MRAVRRVRTASVRVRGARVSIRDGGTPRTWVLVVFFLPDRVALVQRFVASNGCCFFCRLFAHIGLLLGRAVPRWLPFFDVVGLLLHHHHV